MEKPRKSVFLVGFGNKGRDTAKYQFSSRRERPRKPVFQVVQGEEQLNIQELHVTATSVRLRKPVFQVGIGKKSDGKCEKPTESCRYSQFKFNSKKQGTLF